MITHIFSKKIYTKIIHTAIYEPLKLCISHNIVFIKKTPFSLGFTKRETYDAVALPELAEPYNDNQYEYKNVYAIDFSPVDDITDWRIALKLLFGKAIKGKIRLIYFDCIDEKLIQKDIMSTKPTISLETIREIDPDIYDKIINWKPTFQLYNSNCKHFSSYLCT